MAEKKSRGGKAGHQFKRSLDYAPLRMTTKLREFCGTDPRKAAFLMFLLVMLTEDGQALILTDDTMHRLQTETGNPDGWTEEEVQGMLDKLATAGLLSRKHLNRGCIWSRQFAEDSVDQIPHSQKIKREWVKREPKESECETGKVNPEPQMYSTSGRVLTGAERDAEALRRKEAKQAKLNENAATANAAKDAADEDTKNLKKKIDRRARDAQQKEAQQQERLTKAEYLGRALEGLEKDKLKTLDEQVPMPGKEMQHEQNGYSMNSAVKTMRGPLPDAVFEQQQQARVYKPKPNKFCNFSQRNDYDFEELERRKREQQAAPADGLTLAGRLEARRQAYIAKYGVEPPNFPAAVEKTAAQDPAMTM